MSDVWYSRENGSMINNHKGFHHESLRGDLTQDAPKSKPVSVFISKNTVHEAKEEAAAESKKDKSKSALPVLMVGE